MQLIISLNFNEKEEIGFSSIVESLLVNPELLEFYFNFSNLSGDFSDDI